MHEILKQAMWLWFDSKIGVIPISPYILVEKLKRHIKAPGHCEETEEKGTWTCARRGQEGRERRWATAGDEAPVSESVSAESFLPRSSGSYDSHKSANNA